MDDFISYSCGRKSYSLFLGQWTVAFVIFTVFTKFFILDEFGDIHPYGRILLSIWIFGWLTVLLLGFLERFIYCLTIEFHPGVDSRIVERSFFERSRTFDQTVTFRNIIGNGNRIRSSEQWEFGGLLSMEQRLGIVDKLNSRSSKSA